MDLSISIRRLEFKSQVIKLGPGRPTTVPSQGPSGSLFEDKQQTEQMAICQGNLYSSNISPLERQAESRIDSNQIISGPKQCKVDVSAMKTSGTLFGAVPWYVVQ